MNVGILGCGTLGRALALGLRADAAVSQIFATTRGGRDALRDLPGVTALQDNRELVRACDVVVLCVKPFQVEAVVREIALELRAGQVLVSIAASIATAQLRAWSQDRCPVVRAMPNTPCRVDEGMTVIASDGVADAHLAVAQSLFKALGRTVLLEERLLDAATAISGCGPAYAYLIIEALSDAGVRLGLPRKTALLLAAQTMLGSAKMVLESETHPAALKDDVTTPAGCTIDALLVLEDGKLRSTIMRAAIAAAERSATLGRAQPAPAFADEGA
jgi:pyrroline-5-carboxylate reductase